MKLSNALKITTLALILSITSVAGADNSSPNQSEPDRPLRMAKAKASIYKAWFEKVGDKYERRDELVCTKDFEVGVYGIYEPNASIHVGAHMVQCETEFKNQKYSVMAYSNILIQRIIWENNESKTLKVPSGGIQSIPLSNPSGYRPPNTYAFVATEDLGLKNVWLLVNPEVTDEIRQNMLPIFSAVIILEDNP